MQNVLPPALEELIDALGSLPGVGPRTAERYAYYVLRSDEQTAKRLADALNQLHSGVGYCQKTFALVPYGEKLSKLYTDSSRDKTLVAVVADSLDILPIENTNEFKGTYHVLGGLISPIDDIGPSQLHIQALISRIKTDKVKEVILSTNACVEGESAALYIQQQHTGHNLKLT